MNREGHVGFAAALAIAMVLACASTAVAEIITFESLGIASGS
jgi:hypothetical protein